MIVDAFEPRPSLTSGHWMTLYGWGNPRYFPRLPPPTIRYFDLTMIVDNEAGTVTEFPANVAEAAE